MEDIDIIGLFFERSEKAISEVTDKYGKRCLGIANNILLNKEDAEECVNTAYIKLWNAIPPKRPDSLCGYLFAVVRNTAINAYNRIKRRSCEALYDELDTILPKGGSLEEEYDSNETIQLINLYLKKDNRTSAKIFTARYYFNMSVSEIASVMDMSETAVKSRLSRTRSGLRKFLSERGVEV